MSSVRDRARNVLVGWKNSNQFLTLLWLKSLRVRGWWNTVRYSDRQAVIALYKSRSGRAPNLERPARFSEKMQWLKLHFKDPQQTIVADKYAVRGWLADRGYGHLLNDLLAVTVDPADVDFDSLPNQFVIKAAHASGWNLICRDKQHFSRVDAVRLMSEWLRQGIFWNGREWPYRDMPRRVVVERYLEDSSGSLRDFKFYCFNGVPRFVQVNVGRGTTSHAQNFYSLDWRLLSFGKDIATRRDVTIDPPSSLDEMIGIAGNLSIGFPYVRVDLYDVNGRIVFGEMTFYPASGMPDFIPDEADFECGELLVLPDQALH